MTEVPDFLPMAQFQLRPEKQIVSLFVEAARGDGYVYVEDLAEVVWWICHRLWNEVICFLCLAFSV